VTPSGSYAGDGNMPRVRSEIIPERERAKIAEREGERERSTPFGDNATFHY